MGKLRGGSRVLFRGSMLVLMTCAVLVAFIAYRSREAVREQSKLLAICYYSEDATSGGTEMQIIAADIVQYIARVTRPSISDEEIGGGILDREEPPEAYSYIVIRGPASGGKKCRILVVPENRSVILEAGSYIELRSVADRLVLALCRPYALRVARYEKAPSGWVLLMILPGTSDVYAGMWLSGRSMEDIEESIPVVELDGATVEDIKLARILLGDRYIG